MSKENKFSQTNFPKKGEIWLMKCDKIKEFSKDYRPVLIISGNLQNLLDELIVVAPLTTENIETIKPFEVYIKDTSKTGLDEESKIVLNHPFTIFKELRLEKLLGIASPEIMAKVKIA
jgi:mRNA-degrading endonuclease toxin of MazEF toxin-antitoxin module